MAGIIEGLRRVVLHGTPPLIVPLVISTIVSAAMLVLAYGYFKRVEATMADFI
jgi:ABC-type polysaccharide/polyol phosphate export permease